MMVTEVLERLEGVKGATGGWVARCPAHADRSPSLSVGVGEDGKILLRCFAGCAVDEIAASLGFRVRDLFADSEMPAGPKPERRRVEPPKVLPTDMAMMQAYCEESAARLAGPAGDHPTVRYAAERFGVTLEDVHRLGLGHAWLGGGPRLVVPFRDGWGIARGFQARALSADAQVRWMSPKSPERGQWSRTGWFRGRDRDAPVLVTEGPGDALSAVSLGYHAIAIRGAGNASDAHTQDVVMALAAGRHIIICGDGDEAGQRFSEMLWLALQARNAWVTIVPMPDGHDLTDVVQHDREYVGSFV